MSDAPEFPEDDWQDHAYDRRIHMTLDQFDTESGRQSTVILRPGWRLLDDTGRSHVTEFECSGPEEATRILEMVELCECRACLLGQIAEAQKLITEKREALKGGTSH